MSNQTAWHLIHTKPRQERTAREQLERQGYTTYLPEIRQPSKARTPTAPLFPRYLFIRLTAGLDDWTPIRSTRGVSSLVRVGMNPAIISDQLITAIQQRAEADGLHRPPAKTFNKGDRVRLVSGPFADYEAIFSEQRAENRAIILLNLIGQQNRIEVPTDRIATL
ncbi:transcription/translation regulatory transformer protein RfaH [Sedimenticola selenatireducens]|uniref:Transcription/translation regulatory transformer protein RfaH n=1 Tax=Sedimenticola selenatireducens TaxID=191960 RepID=A0A2N6CVU3_9GAMM|nr:transcription/translation regulatory transformer protein RfaH [Sedimenticola selenatireducens]PLX61359.1 MAG: transcription/translation regulatory transformer protein RfaH [Sedimenticola selenatireducens]